ETTGAEAKRSEARRAGHRRRTGSVRAGPNNGQSKACLLRLRRRRRTLRALCIAPDGLTLSDLSKVLHCGRARREEAIAAIRRASWIRETKESRPNAAGRMQ